MSISVMLKPSSNSCNLNCDYCFYKSVSNSREQGFKGMISLDTAKKVISSALDFAKDSQVFFTFQGGEPLLRGVEFYIQFVETVNVLNSKNAKINYCLQTNGTLINKEWADFFKKNNFLVGVSLDGDREINCYRNYPDKSSSFDDVMRGIDFLKESGVTFNVLSVLTKNTAQNFKKAYRFFKQNDIRYLQFIPCLRPFGYNGNDELYMNNDDYFQFLKRGFNIYFNDYMRGEFVSIRSFDNYVALQNSNNAEQCGMNGCCSTQFVVEGDGSVYPCDFYCTDYWLLGNINDCSFDELYHSTKAVEFIKESFKLKDECKACDYFYLCRGGGCKRNKEDYNYCEAYKEFFSSSIHKIKQMKG